MIPDYATAPARVQEDDACAQRLQQHLVAFLVPLLRQLDQHLDARLVWIFLATMGSRSSQSFIAYPTVKGLVK